jgi:putative salt-induced outer membrane protein
MKTFWLVSVLLMSFPAFADGKISDESQAGVVVTSGNTHTQNFNVKSDTNYAWEKNALDLKGNYLRAANDGVVSSLTWLVGLRYERSFSDFLSGFLAQSVEGDEFAGILQRYNSDLGAKYYFRKLDKDFIWFTEVGYRYTNEHDVTGLKKGYQKARIYMEAEKYFASDTSGKLWVEYVPNFTVSKQWLLNSEASITSQLNSIFAFKTAYGLKHNNAPPVATEVKTDTQLSTSLVAKF